MEILKKHLGQSVIDGVYGKGHPLDHPTVLCVTAFSIIMKNLSNQNPTIEALGKQAQWNSVPPYVEEE